VAALDAVGLLMMALRWPRARRGYQAGVLGSCDLKSPDTAFSVRAFAVTKSKIVAVAEGSAAHTAIGLM
jgi:hypothetical protein